MAFKNIESVLFYPKKDQCATSCSFQTQYIAKEFYNCHIRRKDEAKCEKVRDKETVFKNSRVKVVTIDLELYFGAPISK